MTRPRYGPPMHLDGPVVITESDIDPGDLGEPRVVSEDGTTFVVVPPWRPRPMEQAWQHMALSVLDTYGIEATTSSITFWPATLTYETYGWTVRVEIPKPRTGRYQRHWRIYADGETPSDALMAAAAKVLESKP